VGAGPILVISGPSGAGKTSVAGAVAAAFDPSVHIRADEFLPFVAKGWIEPWLPESAHQNDVIGAAIAAAAIQFAVGGYTVVVDGVFFPDGVEGMGRMCLVRGVALHYAVLRADLETCMQRATQRGFGTGRFTFDREQFALLHARFADLGTYETHVVDALTSPEAVAEAVLAAFGDGRLTEGAT